MAALNKLVSTKKDNQFCQNNFCLNVPSFYFVEGKTITITWTVKNYGMGVTAHGAWYDQVYLSRDENRGCIRIFRKIPLISLLECASNNILKENTACHCSTILKMIMVAASREN